MNAIEVMDPRMDSGVELPSDTCRASFDPLSPLLPEEVCYIIDQALACEVINYSISLALASHELMS
jgi:hypothetical protein